MPDCDADHVLRCGNRIKAVPLPKQEARIENWSFDGVRLRGEVYGHPRIKDGHDVSTSLVQRIDFLRNVAETLNTYYLLGKRKRD